jgi:predicted transcriptional regulator
MLSLTVRIDSETHTKLRELAKKHGTTMQRVLHQAVEAYRRQRFFEEANAALETLRNDEEGWNAYQGELREWESTLLDALGDRSITAKASRRKRRA